MAREVEMSFNISIDTWKIELKSSPKIVLLALSDYADKNGICYPSVPTLSRKCGLSSRAIQKNLSKLVSNEYITKIMRSGRSTLYQLNLAKLCTSSVPEPPPNNPPATPDKNTPTPAQNGANPCIPSTHNQSKTSHQPKKNTREQSITLDLSRLADLGVNQQVAIDWLNTRIAKRSGPLTETFLSGIQREAGRAGVSLCDAIRIAAERGWQTFNADWINNTGGSHGTNKKLTGHERVLQANASLASQGPSYAETMGEDGGYIWVEVDESIW